MKIIITSSVSSYDDLERQSMEIDGKEELYVNPLCECPEDATIERDLISCDTVASYMKRAYEAGKNGEDFSIEHKEGDE